MKASRGKLTIVSTMRTQGTIQLRIPTIDLSLTKRLKGGYILYGGELEPAVCEADGPNDSYPDADDEWEPDFDLLDPQDFKDYDFSQEDDSYYDNYSDFQRDENDGHATGVIPPLSADTILNEVIISHILQGQNIGFMFDSDLKQEHSALGYTRFVGQTLPDGSIAERDTIVLSDEATLATLNEELFHVWQGHHCYNGDGFPSEATAPMELMMAVFDFIYDSEYGNGIYSDEEDDKGMGDSLWRLLLDHQILDDDFNVIGFDFDGFIDAWDRSYYEDWKEFYSGEAYGRGSDDNWDWNWAEAYEWWQGVWGAMAND